MIDKEITNSDLRKLFTLLCQRHFLELFDFPENFYTILQLKWKDGKDYKEIAQITGLEYHIVQKKYSKAVLRLKRTIEHFSRKLVDFQHLEEKINLLKIENLELKINLKEPSEEHLKFLTTKTSKLNLSVRAHNCLRRAEINTLGELYNTSANQLMQIPNFGVNTLREIEVVLAKYSLRLKSEIK
jgi:hypothetical protein